MIRVMQGQRYKKKTKRQKDKKKTKRQKDKKGKKTKRQKTDKKQSLVLRRQGSFALLRCFLLQIVWILFEDKKSKSRLRGERIQMRKANDEDRRVKPCNLCVWVHIYGDLCSDWLKTFNESVTFSSSKSEWTYKKCEVSASRDALSSVSLEREAGRTVERGREGASSWLSWRNIQNYPQLGSALSHNHLLHCQTSNFKQVNCYLVWAIEDDSVPQVKV